jgi:hypothetical protein
MLSRSYSQPMDDWVAIAVSVAAAAMAGAALRLSLKQDRRANEHHDVEWQPKWMMWTLWLQNKGTMAAHDVQVVVDYGEDSREVREYSVIHPGGAAEMPIKEFSTHLKIHQRAGGKDFQEEARVRVSWRTKHGTPKSETFEMTLAA